MQPKFYPDILIRLKETKTQTKLNSKLVCFVFQNEIAYNYYSLIIKQLA